MQIEASINQGPIGIFDSGLGGLAVVRQVLNEMPEEDVVYFSDFKNLPYGPRPQEEVKGFTLRAVDFLLSKGAKTVLIGCNTASAAGAEAAAQKYSRIPVIGMIVPAVKATLDLGNIAKVGVIGTIGTIQSGEYEAAFQKASGTVKVFGHACPTILRLAEQGDVSDKDRIRKLAKACVAPLEKEGIDALVLGCTDFTCIMADLLEVLQPDIQLVDPALECTRMADRILEERGWRRKGENGTIRFYASAAAPKDAALFASSIFDISYKDVKLVDIS